MLNFTKKEIAKFKKLNTPAKVQDFLDTFKFNFEEEGGTAFSPLLSLRRGSMHCLEGAMLGAYILSFHGHKPLILHLQATKDDYDHIIALFQIDGLWGALSKTNHYTLRYREPVYKSVHELVMSYFHEYFLNKNGKKTLRKYSVPLDLNTLKINWVTSEEDLWSVDDKLDEIKHIDVINKKAIKSLRKADSIERLAGELVEYKNNPHPKTKIMLFGTFDGVHMGHIDFFKQAKKLAKNVFLIVSVARDKNVLKIKGKLPFSDENKRKGLIEKISLVDKVVLGGMKDHIPHILKERPDVIALGYDQLAYIKNLEKDLKNKGLTVKIIRLKPYKKHIYKNHLINKKSKL